MSFCNAWSVVLEVAERADEVEELTCDETIRVSFETREGMVRTPSAICCVCCGPGGIRHPFGHGHFVVWSIRKMERITLDLSFVLWVTHAVVGGKPRQMKHVRNDSQDPLFP